MLHLFQKLVPAELALKFVHSPWPSHTACAIYRTIGMRGLDARHEADIQPNRRARQPQPDYTDRRPSPVVSLMFTSAACEPAANFGE
jgi:hypothetical protein